MDDRYPVYECGDSEVSRSCEPPDSVDTMVLDNAETQGGRPYNGNYNAAVTEQGSERISVGFNHVIAILAAVVGILCFVLMVGSFYFRSALVRYERKLSDHIQLELRMFTIEEPDEPEDDMRLEDDLLS